MANNTNLGAAKAAKNDEFYTQYADIQKEAVYAQQTAAAREKGESNCQMLCKTHNRAKGNR